jgi:aspartate/glutamate racemase
MNSGPKRVPRIAFVHTVGFLVDLFRRECEEKLPGTDVFHILNESLLKDLLRDGPSPRIAERVVRQALLAVDAGADIVVFTCSSTSPMADIARSMSPVPILKIDEPMAAAAVGAGTKIGLLCTAQSTVAPSTNLLKVTAAANAKSIDVTVSLVAGAYDALFAGDRKEHDALVVQAAATLAKQCDVIVLAQVSLAHLRDEIAARCGKPVFASPSLLMDRLRGDIAALRLA